MDINRIHFDIINSTNTWAKQNAHLFPRDQMTIITADAQTAGRGRFNRHWVSPPGKNIYATFCFFLEKHRRDIGNVPQILAMSTAKMLEKKDFNPELKWPNDVLISQRKVAGILTETTPFSDQICMIVGIGLNVNMPLEVLKGIDRPATSLFVESGQEYNVGKVLQALQEQFVKDLMLFIEEGFHPFLEEYRRRLPIDSNKLIRFHDNRVVWEGYIAAINNDGSLSLSLADNTVKTFIAGEILWPGE